MSSRHVRNKVRCAAKPSAAVVRPDAGVPVLRVEQGADPLFSTAFDAKAQASPPPGATIPTDGGIKISRIDLTSASDGALVDSPMLKKLLEGTGGATVLRSKGDSISETLVEVDPLYGLDNAGALPPWLPTHGPLKGIKMFTLSPGRHSVDEDVAEMIDGLELKKPLPEGVHTMLTNLATEALKVTEHEYNATMTMRRHLDDELDDLVVNHLMELYLDRMEQDSMSDVLANLKPPVSSAENMALLETAQRDIRAGRSAIKQSNVDTYYRLKAEVRQVETMLAEMTELSVSSWMENGMVPSSDTDRLSDMGKRQFVAMRDLLERIERASEGYMGFFQIMLKRLLGEEIFSREAETSLWADMAADYLSLHRGSSDTEKIHGLNKMFGTLDEMNEIFKRDDPNDRSLPRRNMSDDTPYLVSMYDWNTIGRAVGRSLDANRSDRPLASGAPPRRRVQIGDDGRVLQGARNDPPPPATTPFGPSQPVGRVTRSQVRSQPAPAVPLSLVDRYNNNRSFQAPSWVEVPPSAPSTRNIDTSLLGKRTRDDDADGTTPGNTSGSSSSGGAGGGWNIGDAIRKIRRFVGLGENRSVSFEARTLKTDMYKNIGISDEIDRLKNLLYTGVIESIDQARGVGTEERVANTSLTAKIWQKVNGEFTWTMLGFATVFALNMVGERVIGLGAEDQKPDPAAVAAFVSPATLEKIAAESKARNTEEAYATFVSSMTKHLKVLGQATLVNEQFKHTIVDVASTRVQQLEGLHLSENYTRWKSELEKLRSENRLFHLIESDIKWVDNTIERAREAASGLGLSGKEFEAAVQANVRSAIDELNLVYTKSHNTDAIVEVYRQMVESDVYPSAATPNPPAPGSLAIAPDPVTGQTAGDRLVAANPTSVRDVPYSTVAAGAVVSQVRELESVLADITGGISSKLLNLPQQQRSAAELERLEDLRHGYIRQVADLLKLAKSTDDKGATVDSVNKKLEPLLRMLTLGTFDPKIGNGFTVLETHDASSVIGARKEVLEHDFLSSIPGAKGVGDFLVSYLSESTKPEPDRVKLDELSSTFDNLRVDHQTKIRNIREEAVTRLLNPIESKTASDAFVEGAAAINAGNYMERALKSTYMGSWGLLSAGPMLGIYMEKAFSSGFRILWASIIGDILGEFIEVRSSREFLLKLVKRVALSTAAYMFTTAFPKWTMAISAAAIIKHVVQLGFKQSDVHHLEIAIQRQQTASLATDNTTVQSFGGRWSKIGGFWQWTNSIFDATSRQLSRGVTNVLIGVPTLAAANGIGGALSYGAGVTALNVGGMGAVTMWTLLQPLFGESTRLFSSLGGAATATLLRHAPMLVVRHIGYKAIQTLTLSLAFWVTDKVANSSAWVDKQLIQSDSALARQIGLSIKGLRSVGRHSHAVGQMFLQLPAGGFILMVMLNGFLGSIVTEPIFEVIGKMLGTLYPSVGSGLLTDINFNIHTIETARIIDRVADRTFRTTWSSVIRGLTPEVMWAHWFFGIPVTGNVPQHVREEISRQHGIPLSGPLAPGFTGVPKTYHDLAFKFYGLPTFAGRMSNVLAKAAELGTIKNNSTTPAL